jgi:toxin YoeB
MKQIVFDPQAFQDFTEWAETDRKMYQRIVALIKDILRHPFTGIGKPEPLKHELRGWWSRRINREHRVVYKSTAAAIVILSCKYHYTSR